MSYKYVGLVRAKIYNKDDIIRNAQDEFFSIDENSWLEISNKMTKHVKKFFPKKEYGKNTWQSGFGGDDSDGTIDFALQAHPPAISDMRFKFNGKFYTMKFGEPDME